MSNVSNRRPSDYTTDFLRGQATAGLGAQQLKQGIAKLTEDSEQYKLAHVLCSTVMQFTDAISMNDMVLIARAMMRIVTARRASYTTKLKAAITLTRPLMQSVKLLRQMLRAGDEPQLAHLAALLRAYVEELGPQGLLTIEQHLLRLAQSRGGRGDDKTIAHYMNSIAATNYILTLIHQVYDALYFAGKSLRGAPQTETETETDIGDEARAKFLRLLEEHYPEQSVEQAVGE